MVTSDWCSVGIFMVVIDILSILPKIGKSISKPGKPIDLPSSYSELRTTV